MRIHLLAIVLLTALQSGAVSRVGGGKVSSQSSGFEMDVLPPFQPSGSGDDIRFMGPTAYISSLGYTSQFFQIAEFTTDFPEYAKSDRSDLLTNLAAKNWQILSGPSRCVLLFKKNENGVVTYISIWGHGKGFVLKGLNTPEVEKSMEQGLTSVKLKGGCSWK